MALHDRWDNIAYMWTNGLLNTLPTSFTNNISPKKIHKKIGLIIKDIAADFLRLFHSSRIPKDKIWFLVLTKNNYDSLKDVKSKTSGSIFISFYRFRSTINDNTYYFNLKGRFFRDLFYPITWLIYFLRRPRKALRYFDIFFRVHGTFYECLRLLKKTKPKGIVFTNDHLVEARSMLLAANKLNISTYYIPHASVSSYFPPLEFSYALLDGQDALDKYKNCGPVKSRIELMGMPKFDKHTNDVNEANKVNTIGIAFNLVDKIEDVTDLAKNIQNCFKELDIILRPHPGDKRSLGNIPKGISISDSKKEDAFTFLKQIDALVSSESSIHLEAVLLNVYPLCYTFTPNNRFDFYGFIERGLVDNFENVDVLVKKIQELQFSKPDVRSRARYYNAAIGTEFYGKTCELMSKFIEEKAR